MPKALEEVIGHGRICPRGRSRGGALPALSLCSGRHPATESPGLSENPPEAERDGSEKNPSIRAQQSGDAEKRCGDRPRNERVANAHRKLRAALRASLFAHRAARCRLRCAIAGTVLCWRTGAGEPGQGNRAVRHVLPAVGLPFFWLPPPLRVNDFHPKAAPPSWMDHLLRFETLTCAPSCRRAKPVVTTLHHFQAVGYYAILSSCISTLTLHPHLVIILHHIGIGAAGRAAQPRKERSACLCAFPHSSLA